MLLVPPRGLEPLRLSTQVPKTWVSANSTIAAYGGEGGTRTHKPLITTTGFQDQAPPYWGQPRRIRFPSSDLGEAALPNLWNSYKPR